VLRYEGALGGRSCELLARFAAGRVPAAPAERRAADLWSSGGSANRLSATRNSTRGGPLEEFDQEQSGSEQLDEVEEEAADLDTGDDEFGEGDDDADFDAEDGDDDI
jgi:hypothetical protein